MPLTVFATKGVPATRRQRIETAVEAGGKHIKDPYEAWITTDPIRGGAREATQVSLYSVLRGGHRRGLLRTPSE